MKYDIVSLTIENCSVLDKTSGHNAFTKAVFNINSIWGPAIISLPFVMQRSGLIPSIIAYFLICVLSLFSQLCVKESYNILKYSRITSFNNKFDLVNLTQILIKTDLFARLAKYFIYINHSIFSIMSMITINKMICPCIGQLGLHLNHKLDFIPTETFIFVISFTLYCTLLNISKYFKTEMNYIFLLITLILIYFMMYEIISFKEVITLRIDYFGSDYTYLFGTVLFSFSYISVMPSWIESTNGSDEKSILNYSCIFTFFFKVIFSLTFANTLYFNSLFNFSAYVSSQYSFGLKITIACYLLLIFTNNIVIHTTLLTNYLETYSNLTNTKAVIYAIGIPWIVSLLLINNQIYLIILNWSSLFIFGFVNYILPLLLYISSIKMTINYEKNYYLSAKLGFEDFVYLKASEVGMTLIEFDPQGDIFKIINDFKNRLKLQEYIDDATKDMMIEIFYEFDGNYSTKRSFYQIFGGVFKFNIKKIMRIYYFIITAIFMLTSVSIFMALYKFLINKTLVVNIFLQTNELLNDHN